MNTDSHACIVCEQTSQDIPLLMIEHQGRQYWICPEHLPILIHRPHELAEILPGAEKLHGHRH